MSEDPQCRVCGHANRADALFCDRCTSPVGVVALGDLTEEDYAHCRSALFHLLATMGPHSPSETSPLWLRYLSAFWLRPETALICFAEARALREIASDRRDRWLDLGCGDGIHSALAAGWSFDDAFDAFQGLDLAAADIYHHWDPARFGAEVTERGETIAIGCDIKETAIERSRALGVFDRLILADATELPIDAGSIDGIFSNMLRDLGPTLGPALAECCRVLSDDGRLYISAMTPHYADNLYFAPLAQKSVSDGLPEEYVRFLLRLDRGRSVFCRQQLSAEKWNELLHEAGLEVVRTVPLVGAKTIKFWDVGFRPFSVQLIEQAQKWREQGVLKAVKPPMVTLLDTLLRSLTVDRGEEVPCMNLLEIAKR